MMQTTSRTNTPRRANPAAIRNGLRIHSQPSQKYLVETDPRFTDYKTYTGSDYLLSRLTLDPQLSQKRLGDGFYEQKLISDQITELTGRRFIGQYTSTDDQAKALMDSGVTEAHQLNLSTGIALSKEQVAALTSDIVWMVEENITLADGSSTLADGSSTQALVPRVYLSAQHAKDLKPDGALIAADTLDINSSGSVDNTGTIKSTSASMIAAKDIFNSGGTLSSGGDMVLKASHDISNSSGSIAGHRVALSAGNNILNTTATQSFGVGNAGFGASNTLVGATGSITATDSLSLDALNNITILGASLKAGGDAQLKAGNNLTVGTVTSESGTFANNSYFNFNTKNTTQLTSNIQTGGNLSLSSGKDMQLTSSTLDIGKSASLVSGGNLTVDAAKNITSHDAVSGLNINRAYDETVLGSNIKAGGNITLAAVSTDKGQGGSGKGNISLLSANISSDTGKLNVVADNNVNIGTTARRADLRDIKSHGETR